MEITEKLQIEISLCLGIFPNDTDITLQILHDTNKSKFIAAQFTKPWKQSTCLSTEECIKTFYLYIMEHYTWIKKGYI